MAKAGSNLRPIKTELQEPTPIVGLSIQGEQQHKRDQTHMRMDQDLVNENVANMSDDCVECRSGSHRFPVIRPRDGIRFAGNNSAGMPLQRLRCLGCKLVDKVVVWTTTDGVNWWPDRSYLDYSIRGENGEKYLLDQPGQGRMARRQVQAALMSQALEGLTIAQILKAAKNGAVITAAKRRRTRKAS